MPRDRRTRHDTSSSTSSSSSSSPSPRGSELCRDRERSRSRSRGRGEARDSKTKDVLPGSTTFNRCARALSLSQTRTCIILSHTCTGERVIVCTTIFLSSASEWGVLYSYPCASPHVSMRQSIFASAILNHQLSRPSLVCLHVPLLPTYFHMHACIYGYTMLYL